MRRLGMAAALAAALLALAGCGSAGAQTAAPKQAEPKDKAAEFGANLAGLLNNGKSKRLFDLWTGSDDLETEPLADAVMPEAKAKGKARTIDLPSEVFDVPVNLPLMHQVVVAQLAAARAGKRLFCRGRKGAGHRAKRSCRHPQHHGVGRRRIHGWLHLCKPFHPGKGFASLYPEAGERLHV